ncbi:MAG TPA: hypothetical protein QKA14_02645, partial [Candidatus Megaira endosymbiont of Hartmannula sinica]|nr:hypothetical protein [Candidatus Megaera endosymbiont of Hartmannula sinica]
MSLESASNLFSKIFKTIGKYLPFNKRILDNLNYINYKEILQDKKYLNIFITRLWDNFGRYIAEFMFINKISQKIIDKKIKINGLQNIANATGHSQNPFILSIAHQANWDFVIQAITKLYPKFVIVYKKIKNPYLNRFILKTRSGNNTKDTNIIMVEKSKKGSRKLIEAIKKGYSVVMLTDQRINDGIKVPFFGMDALTARGIVRISKKYKYPILPVQIIREKKTCSFSVNIHKKLNTNNLSDYEILKNLNNIMEGWIRKCPQQWFWFHKRWKISD